MGNSSRTVAPITARSKRLKFDNVSIWSWLLGICDPPEELRISRITHVAVTSLAGAIRNLTRKGKPCPDAVSLDGNDLVPTSIESLIREIKPILSAGTKGWKAVDCGFMAQVGSRDFDPLLQHLSTLEEFFVARVEDTTGIMSILKSCPELPKLVTIEYLYNSRDAFLQHPIRSLTRALFGS